MNKFLSFASMLFLFACGPVPVNKCDCEDDQVCVRTDVPTCLDETPATCPTYEEMCDAAQVSNACIADLCGDSEQRMFGPGCDDPVDNIMCDAF